MVAREVLALLVLVRAQVPQLNSWRKNPELERTIEVLQGYGDYCINCDHQSHWGDLCGTLVYPYNPTDTCTCDDGP